MEAIYADTHAEKSMGMRKHVASMVPEDTKVLLDLGAGGESKHTLSPTPPPPQSQGSFGPWFWCCESKHYN